MILLSLNYEHKLKLKFKILVNIITLISQLHIKYAKNLSTIISKSKLHYDIKINNLN